MAKIDDALPNEIVKDEIFQEKEVILPNNEEVTTTEDVNVTMDEDGNWEISKVTEGDKVAELLTTRNYDIRELTSSYEAQLQKKLSCGNIEEKEKIELKKFLEDQLNETPYLQQKS